MNELEIEGFIESTIFTPIGNKFTSGFVPAYKVCGRTSFLRDKFIPDIVGDKWKPYNLITLMIELPFREIHKYKIFVNCYFSHLKFITISLLNSKFVHCNFADCSFNNDISKISFEDCYFINCSADKDRNLKTIFDNDDYFTNCCVADISDDTSSATWLDKKG